jgi:maltooligosyltrehalose trehalohydrolase
VDPSDFPRRDHDWSGPDVERLVIYELHVGTFTREGTFEAIIPELRRLRRLGVTAIELMPIAAFPGQRNWGYDGVDLFAPCQVYGGPQGLDRLVDAAHREGLGVLLDVVYNHLGPDGNYLRAYAEEYFTHRHRTPWGDALNFDGPGSGRVRELFVQNACYWLVEHHVDGLRLDATHAIVDDSERHILAEIADAARAAVGPTRRIFLAAEDGRNDISMARPLSAGGLGLDAIWADDFHHTIHVQLTGEREGYYADYTGAAAEIATTIRSGFFYQGQFSPNRGAPRGKPVGDDAAREFIFCLQNHDQIGNRGFGERLNVLVGDRVFAVATVLLLLAPETPLLFMGQEYAATTPFLYFTDHHDELGRLVTVGRREEFAKFRAFCDPALREQIPDPQAESTFLRSRLDPSERERNPGYNRLFYDLMRLRQTDVVFADPDRARTATSAPGDHVVAMRRWNEDATLERVVIANFGPALEAPLAGDSALASLERGDWKVILSIAVRRYGGSQIRTRLSRVEPRRVVRIPAETAVVFSTSGPIG